MILLFSQVNLSCDSKDQIAAIEGESKSELLYLILRPKSNQTAEELSTLKEEIKFEIPNFQSKNYRISTIKTLSASKLVLIRGGTNVDFEDEFNFLTSHDKWVKSIDSIFLIESENLLQYLKQK